ncbi:MAG: hypothetical protein ABGY41_01295 [Candidatus Poribacteria bacterium]
MSRNPFADLLDDLVSYLPADVVRHMAAAERELLLGVKACVGDCVDWAVGNLDACVDASETYRQGREETPGDSAKVDIEEDAEPTGEDTEPDAEPTGQDAEPDADSPE